MSKEAGSFFRTKVKNLIYFYFVIYFVFGAIIPFLMLFITGLIGLINGTGMQIIFYMSPMPLILLILMLFIPGPIYYNRIKKLLDEKNEAELIKIAELVNFKSIIALCALFELNPLKVRPLLDKYNIKSGGGKIGLSLLPELTKRVVEFESNKDNVLLETAEVEAIIPITKVYFIKNSNELGKGMISKTQLVLDTEISVCPNCRNMEKKELLVEWLKEKNTCPICFTKISIDDCPIVDIREY